MLVLPVFPAPAPAIAFVTVKLPERPGVALIAARIRSAAELVAFALAVQLRKTRFPVQLSPAEIMLTP